jgi:NAD(P)-dependent dehydrogenase (short-subunit alcohol dehydrogenase family)
MDIHNFDAVVDAAAEAFDCSSEWTGGLDEELLTPRIAHSVEHDVEAGVTLLRHESDYRPTIVVVRDLFDLKGRSAIVTGGGTGLGSYFAEALAEAGANLLLCARKAERCEAIAAALRRNLGVNAIAMRCDVRDKAQVEAVVARAASEFGSVDILVNNAGTSWGAPVVDYPLEGWQKVIDVNLTGLFLFAQTAGREMIRAGRGKIVNIASVAAFSAAPPELMDAIAYSASKGGVVSLTRDLAVKWARHGITVNAIAPGWFPTEMSEALLERSGEAFLERIPLGRFGGPADIKGAVVFLASDASNFVTGQTLVVDGGQTAS